MVINLKHYDAYYVVPIRTTYNPEYDYIACRAEDRQGRLIVAIFIYKNDNIINVEFNEVINMPSLYKYSSRTPMDPDLLLLHIRTYDQDIKVNI